MGDELGRSRFYFDLGSPYAYLAAERISGLAAAAGIEQPIWEPILLGGLFKRFGRVSWSLTDARAAGIAEVERRSASYGLPPVRWPVPWPPDSLYAMRAAVYAKSIGRSVSFALAAFRQAFAGGRDLTDPANVAIAAAACEIHPRALAAGIASRSVKDALITATNDAAAAGVSGVPSLVVDDQVYWGDDRLEEAIAAAASSAL